MIREEAIEIWRTHFARVLGVMILRTPSWMTLYKGKRGSIKNVISACVNLSQDEVSWALMWSRRMQHPGSMG